MTVSLDQLRARIARMDQRRRAFELQAQQPPRRLQLHETWRHAYLAHPYLLGAPDDRLAERFRQVFMNASEIGPSGKIQLVALSETDEFMQAFTHVQEEYAVRTGGHPPKAVIASAKGPIEKYFEHGEPIGVTLFRGYAAPTTPILVKYGERRFLEPMFQTGTLRLANAESYNNAGYLDAVRDDETSRYFFIPTYRARLDGQTQVEVQGHTLSFRDDDIVLPVVVEDYFLFSLCETIHYRMPTDFGADAAIVIRDPVRFKQRLISTVLSLHPEWIPMEGKVTYYDPYRDFTKFRVPEMAKHFGYAYQKEVRVAFRTGRQPAKDLKPIFLSIGPMTEYADLICL